MRRLSFRRMATSPLTVVVPKRPVHQTCTESIVGIGLRDYFRVSQRAGHTNNISTPRGTVRSMSSPRWRRIRVGRDADEMPVESHGAVDVRSFPTSKGEGRNAGLGLFHLQALEQRI